MQSLKLRWLSIVLSVALLVLALSISSTTSTAQGSNQYDGVDILFVVDQSGSMGGIRYNGDPIWGQGNDEQDLRFFGPDYALRWLSRFHSTVVNNPPAIRYGLLTFGDSRRFLLDWVDLDTSDPDWENLTQPQLRDDISSDRFGNVNLGYTDFIGAMRESRQIFEDAPPTPPDQLHLTVVVLLTDGAPCVPTADDPFPVCQELPPETAVNHLDVVRSIIQQNLPNTLIYVVALDATDSYFPNLEQDWINTVCVNTSNCPDVRVTQVRNEPELSSHLNTILSNVVQQVSNVSQSQIVGIPPGTFYVPPYTQLVAVNMFKTDDQPLGNVNFFDPNDQLAPNVAPTGFDTPIEEYEIQLPQYGTWRVDTNNLDTNRVEQLIVSTDIISAGGQLNPAPPTVIDKLVPTDFTVEIVDSAGTALVDDPNAPDLTVELGFYDATPLQRNNRQQIFSQVIPRDDVTRPDTNVFAGDVVFNQPGEYEVRLSAYYTDPQTNTRADLIFDETLLSSITVQDITIDWSGITPNSQRQGAPMTVRADIYRRGSTALFDDPDIGNLVFNVTLEDDNGNVSTEILPDENAAVGTIEANLVVDDPATYRATVEVGRLQDDGSFVPLQTNDARRTFNGIDVRPVTQLELQLTAPRDPSSEVRTVPRFWETQPVTIRAELLNAVTKAPLAISALTDSAEILPELTITRDDQPYAPDDPLVEIRPGVYELTTVLPRGDYNVTARINTPPSDYTGDYELPNPTASLNHERVWSPYIIPLVGAIIGSILLLLLLIIAAIYWQVQRRYDLTQNPIKGRVTIYMLEDGLDGPNTREIDLSSRGLNTINLGAKDLPGELQSLTLSNDGDVKNVRDGVFYIRGYKYDGEEVNINMLVVEGGEETLHYDYNRGLTIAMSYSGDQVTQEGGINVSTTSGTFD